MKTHTDQGRFCQDGLDALLNALRLVSEKLLPEPFAMVGALEDPDKQKTQSNDARVYGSPGPGWLPGVPRNRPKIFGSKPGKRGVPGTGGFGLHLTGFDRCSVWAYVFPAKIFCFATVT